MANLTNKEFVWLELYKSVTINKEMIVWAKENNKNDSDTTSEYVACFADKGLAQMIKRFPELDYDNFKRTIFDNTREKKDPSDQTE